MSYLNSEQQSYVRHLASIPPERKCWCGWYTLAEGCFACGRGPNAGRTLADRLQAEQCRHCGGLAYDPRHIPGQRKTHDYEPAKA